MPDTLAGQPATSLAGKPAVSLASKMRTAAQDLGEFRIAELADAVGVQTFAARQNVKRTISDFVKRGEMERVSRGLYRYCGLKKERTKLDIIWHLVRSHRHFGLDEMERLSGAARGTVREYVQCLVRAGYLRKTSRTRWLLVNDPGPATPVNSAKCARLKKIRSAVALRAMADRRDKQARHKDGG